ncbi:T9SS type A sorting domain-containing protein [Aquimarina algiphila]|uniref:T9SS type A sorting domain-containing protein n=1 Tax=Aquimarina algiphila TaxID=2047982 RepID=UPI00232E1002|nr:T9SS type A sorting domain-containing protein [Aquimarina algiphila]
MKTTQFIRLLLCILGLFIFSIGYAQPPGENASDWTVVNELTDEFNGSNLNTGKWKYGHPWWGGRSPALFGGANNAFLSGNGLLVIRATWVGGSTNYMRTGSIHSTGKAMKVGMYSECQFRANSLRMGSAFWFANNDLDANNRGDEIDVQEAFGGLTNGQEREMHTNIHNPQPNFTNDQPQPNKFILSSGTVSDSYHTYGVWIVNSNTVRFYLDGVFQKQVITNSPQDPQYMMIDAETYNWMKPWPTQAEVTNGAKRDMYVSYVRTWRKTGNSNPNPGGGSKVSLKGNNGKYVSSENGNKAMTCNRSSVQGWEKFTMNVLGSINGNDQVSLQGNNGKYVSSENGLKDVFCNRGSVGAWEKFELIHHGNNVYSFKGSNGKYLSSENGSGGMTCSRSSLGSWEKFTIAFGVKNNQLNTKDVKDIKNEIAMYPNPIEINNPLNMAFKLGEKTEISIDLYDAVGHKVLSNKLGTFDAGNHDLELFTRSNKLSSGIYILKTKMNDVVTVDRLMFN